MSIICGANRRPRSQLSETKVDYFHRAVRFHNDVLGFQVPVRYPVIVCGSKSGCNLYSYIKKTSCGQWCNCAYRPQGLPFDILADNVRPAILLADIIDGHDV